jgi:hypothetical protein
VPDHQGVLFPNLRARTTGFSLIGREAATALYETIRRIVRRLLDAASAALEVMTFGLTWVGVSLLVVASVLLVYLGAVLLARLGAWAFYP